MSGTFNTQKAIIRTLRTSSAFTQYCRSLQSPLSINFQKRRASIWATKSGKNGYVIKSNCRDDKKIYSRLEKSHVISKFLGLSKGHFNSEILVNQSKKLFKTKQVPEAKKAIAERPGPENVVQTIVLGDGKEPLDLEFSEGGKKVLSEDRGTMERTLSLLPEDGLEDTIRKTEEALLKFSDNYTIKNARYLEVDLYFPIPVLAFKQAFLASLLSQSKTLSELTYAPEEAREAPIDTLEKKAKGERIKTVLANKMGIKDESLKKMISTGPLVKTPGFISGHRSCAVLIEARHNETNETSFWVSSFEVEMAPQGVLKLEDTKGSEVLDFRSKGLNSGANFAYGGEAGDVSKAIGGDYLLRQHASEEDAMTAIFGVPDITQTRHFNLYTEYEISPEDAGLITTRNLLMRDNVSGIYSDFPMTAQNPLPILNCGSIIWEQKILTNLPINALELTMPISDQGKISISIDDLSKEQPDYWLHIAMRSGLKAAYAVQWAECVFDDFKKTDNIKTTKTSEEEIKEQLRSMFVEAYFGLHGAAIWQELFAEYWETGFQDNKLNKQVKNELEGFLGTLALIRPASIALVFGKMANAYPEFLAEEGNGEMLEIVNLMKTTKQIMEPPVV